MAGDWIKFETATPDKPEVCEIANELNIDPDAVVGKLLRIWCWFDQQTENGNAPSVSKMLLDRLVGVTGFCKIVIDCGWMLDDGKQLSLPHFDRHNGKTAKNRALTAKRVASHKAKSNADGNEQLTPDALPKEEKRREEKDNIADPSDSAPVDSPLNCPHTTIIEIYHRILPELPRVLDTTWKGSSREKDLQARWRHDKRHQNLDFWEAYFEGVSRSRFHLGDNERGWKADLGWLVKRSNFDKMVERIQAEII
jgi:hypothetical protein